MKKAIYLIFGFISYGFFLASFLYAVGFVGDFIVPRTVDTGIEAPMGTALLINLLLLGLFAVQHSVMARPTFKKWWTKIVPKPIERSIYVLLTSLLLLLIFWQWRPMAGWVWYVEHQVVATVFTTVFWLGWAIVFISTFMINHFDLFGLRQVMLYAAGKEYTYPGFTTTGLYRYVRHPIMLGFLIAFWATPQMSVGHLVFACATTGYMIIGIYFEERNLRQFLGRTYENYQHCVPMLIPFSKLWVGRDNECRSDHLFEP